MTHQPDQYQEIRDAVRALCAFTAKAGDLDVRFTPAPTAAIFACASASFKVNGWKTSMPFSSASFLTGDGCSAMPRPAGRSGWVSTNATSCPAATIACRARRSGRNSACAIASAGARARTRPPPLRPLDSR